MTAAADLLDLRGLNNSMWTLGKGARRERSFGGMLPRMKWLLPLVPNYQYKLSYNI